MPVMLRTQLCCEAKGRAGGAASLRLNATHNFLRGSDRF